MVDGRAVTYRLFVPAASSAGPVPLVVALHRFTETGSIMARITGFDAIAEREGFIVVYPDGPGRRFDFGNGSRDDIALVLAVIDDVAAAHAIDPSRVYVTGASNGGFMTYALLDAVPERFAAAAPVMAAMPDADERVSADAPPVPILIIHGMADRIVPAEVSRMGGFRMTPLEDTIAAWRERNGCTDEPIVEPLPDTDPDDRTRTVRTRYEPAGDGAEVVVYRVIGGGHTWPGGREPSPRFIVGRVSRDFSASEAIWEFFAAHRRAAPEG